MKSIMQEASSVIKAVEKAWEAAGNPKEFSVKVYEEAQRNFLGMTTKNAKIAIFFDGVVVEQEKPKPVQRSAEPQKKREQQRRKEKEPEQKPVETSAKKEQPAQQNVIWSEQMLDFVRDWLKKSLTIMGMSDVSFSMIPEQYQLKISFAKPLVEHEEKERSLFRNFSLFIIQALRHKFHRPMRGFYIVFERG